MPLDLRRVPLDRQYFTEFANRHYGSIGIMVSLWNEEEPHLARSSQSFYKWLDHGAPMTPSGYSLFRFLGIDPVALIDHERLNVAGRFNAIRAALMMMGQSVIGIRSLLEPLLPSENWPNDQLLADRFGRKWHREKFQHDATGKINAMACVTLSPNDPDAMQEHPTAWYIAYRPGDGTDPMWRPYGIMVRRAGINRLLSSRGLLTTDDSFQRRTVMQFGTEYGPAPVDFCVASHHGFSADVEFPTERTCKLRFLP